MPDHPKGDAIVQTPWESETADLCKTRPQLRHCSLNEVVEVDLRCLSQMRHSWVSLKEQDLQALVREGRREVRVSALTEEKRELVRANSQRSAASRNTPQFKLPLGEVCTPRHSSE